MSRSTQAFTLIEMLVVVTLIAILSSMIIVLYEDSAEDAVSKSALELKSVLERARGLAIKTGRMHAVSFHIENAGDGSVMKNFSSIDDEKFPGRHWYCIIGPDFSTVGTTAGWSRDQRKIPVVRDGQNGRLLSFYCLADHVETMKDVQVGPRHYLLPGVRFLALGDLDKIYTKYSDPTYPRPWFGYYDDATNRLHPWGGYDPEIDKKFTHPTTGLDYQGEDPVVPEYYAPYDTRINPTAVWGRIHPDATAPDQEHIDDGSEDPACKLYRGFSQGYIGPDTSYLASTATRKVPRPLINAYWGDFMILFDAKGTARAVKSDGRDTFFGAIKWYGGRHSSRPAKGDNFGRHDMGMVDMVDKTGGFYITICRDIEEENLYKGSNSVTGGTDYQQFSRVEDALESITPYKRIFVHRATGTTDIRGMGHPHCALEPDDLKQQKPYPRGF